MTEKKQELDIKEEIEKGAIHCRVMIEILGKPKEHVVNTMYLEEAAEHLGITKYCLLKWLKIYKITERKFSFNERRKIPTKEILIEDLKDLNPLEVSKKYNVSKSTVYKWMGIYDLKKHKPSKEEFEKNYQQLSPKALSKKYDVTLPTIKAWAKNYNLL